VTDHHETTPEDVAEMQRWPAGRKLLAARDALIHTHAIAPEDVRLTHVPAAPPASITASAVGISVRRDGVWCSLEWDQAAFVWNLRRGTLDVGRVPASTPFLFGDSDADLVYGGKVASLLAGG